MSSSETQPGESGVSISSAQEQTSAKAPVFLRTAPEFAKLDESMGSQQLSFSSLTPSTATLVPEIVIRYTAEELLVLRDSVPHQLPSDFSPYTPLRPGSLIKLPEITLTYNQDGNRNRSASNSSHIGFEHMAKSQRDSGLSTSHRVSSHASFRSLQNVAQRAHAREARAASIAGGNASSISLDSNSIAATRHHKRPEPAVSSSWRSSNKQSSSASAVRGGNSKHYSQRQSQRYEDHSQPEWMDEDLPYDEGQSAKGMQDIEEWKRRMNGEQPAKNNAGPTTATTTTRKSRFLQLFSNNENSSNSNSNSNNLREIQEDRALSNNSNKLQQERDDQLSKLFNVFGNKVNASTTGSTPPHQQQLISPRKKTTAVPVENGLFNVSAFGHKMRTSPTTTNTNAQGSQTTAYGSGIFPNMPASSAASNNITNSQQSRVKSSSPATINEALRGIVPTSVFRKSVQSSSGSGGASTITSPNNNISGRSERIYSESGNRNLPSWLVELSRGQGEPLPLPDYSSSATEYETRQQQQHQSLPPLGNTTITTTKDAQTLINNLEREFPALGVSPAASKPTTTHSQSNPPAAPSSVHASSMQQGMMSMAQPHMVMPNGHHGTGGMIPPPSSLNGFAPMNGYAPNVMYGMVPPPPPQAVFSQMVALHPPVTSNEHQQMLMLKMMMQQQQDMPPPPGMIYGPPPPHMPLPQSNSTTTSANMPPISSFGPPYSQPPPHL